MALIRNFSFPNELGFRGRGSDARFIPRLGLRDQFKLNQMRQEGLDGSVSPDVGGGLLEGPTGGGSGLGGSLGGQNVLDQRLTQNSPFDIAAFLSAQKRFRPRQGGLNPGFNLANFFSGLPGGGGDRGGRGSSPLGGFF